MNASLIRICCPRCAARIKAPAQLAGQKRDCPRCGQALLVRRVRPRDSDPVLVLIEGEEMRPAGVAYRRGA